MIEASSGLSISFFSLESCDNVKCPSGKFCVEDQYRLPHCVNNAICTTKCPIKEDDEMLCGTNGVTYRNVCFLRQVVCRKGIGRRVGIAYKGACKGKQVFFQIVAFYHMLYNRLLIGLPGSCSILNIF